MTTFALILDLLFVVLLGIGILTGMKLIWKIDAYLKSLPDLKRTMSALNASILHAESTVSKLGDVGGMSPKSARISAARQTPQEQPRTTSNGELPASLSALIEAASKKQQA